MRTLPRTRVAVESLGVVALGEATAWLVAPIMPGGITDAALLALHVGIMMAFACAGVMVRLRAWTSHVEAAHASTPATRPRGACVAVLLAGLLATGVLTARSVVQIRAEASVRFDRLTDHVVGEVGRRVDAVRFGLAGARGVYLSSKSVERAEFEDYVASRDLPREFPGALGIGVIERVPKADVDAFFARERADGEPNLNLRVVEPLDQSLASEPDRLIIKHCFPWDRNAPAWGLDVGSERHRRNAAQRAIDTGEPAISAKIHLVQDESLRAGFLYFLPVYKRDTYPITVETRRASLDVLVYAPIMLDDALDGICEVTQNMLDYEVFDGGDPSRGTQMYDHDHHRDAVEGDFHAAHYEDRMFHRIRGLEVAGHQWSVVTSSTPAFEATLQMTPAIITGVGGTLLSIMSAAFVRSLLTSRVRAVRLAEQMTHDLAAAKTAAEDALRETQVLQGTLNNHSIVSVADASGKIIAVNDEFCRISGYSREELIGKDHRVVNSGTHPKAFWVNVWQTIASGNPWRGEVCNRAKDGSLYWVDSIIAPFIDADGYVDKYVSIRNDITSRKHAEQQLEMMALTDRLTGLPNRAQITRKLEQAVERAAKEPKHRFAFLFLDFDRFKFINDTMGHEAGDKLLIGIAQRLRSALKIDASDASTRSPHTAARLGGDEFVVLLEGLKECAEADRIAGDLVRVLGEPHTISNQQVVSTASIGVVHGDPSMRATDLLRDADTAMYEAKAAGKGRFVVFDNVMRERILRRVRIERDIHEAHLRGELFVHHQPIVNLSSARIEGVEALVRWQHPELGLISPADFVPVAEECGAITTITEWMVRQACIQHHAWSSTLGSQTPRISVNLSRIDLSVPDLAARFTAILAESGVSPRSVSLEVTETAVMRDHKSAVSALRKLRDAGFRLALDDFGTGYSSLSTLHQFPLDVVKLDRSFLANSVQRREYAALVQALVTLAGNLGMSVTAEGIETAEQVAMLQAVECQHAQGWFFGKPMSAADLAARILAQGDEHEQGGAARTRIAA